MKKKLQPNYLFLVLAVISTLLFSNTAFSKDRSSVIVIHDSTILRSDKEAFIIISGLENSKKGRDNQQAYFKNEDFDLFIPDYIDPNSFDSCVNNFTQFYKDQKLIEYRKVHVLSYILGSWVLNTYINQYGKGNISTIVYDRSPLQERAPTIAVKKIPRITRWLKGDVVRQLSLIEYPPVLDEDINIGILVESKATPLIRHFKKETLEMGTINWTQLEFNQRHDDLIFIRANHDEMYITSTFNEIGPDILHFIKTGKFKKLTQRKWFDWDPFEKWKG